MFIKDSVGISHYINLHDAYISFKEKFVGSDDEEIMEQKPKKKIAKKTKKKKKKKKKKNRHSKQEMSTDDENSENEKGENHKVSEREKRNHIQFRMSVDDLKFCGFIKTTNRKKEALMKMAELL